MKTASATCIIAAATVASTPKLVGIPDLVY